MKDKFALLWDCRSLILKTLVLSVAVAGIISVISFIWVLSPLICSLVFVSVSFAVVIFSVIDAEDEVRDWLETQRQEVSLEE